MIIRRPIQTNNRTQRFGENKACVKQVNGETVRPYVVKGTSTGVCPTDYVPMYPEMGFKGHNGEDWKTWNGEPLYFPVQADTEWWSRSEVDPDGGIGLDVFSSKRIKLNSLPPHAGKLARREFEENDGNVYVKFRFWHLKQVLVPDAKRPSPEEPRPTPNVVYGQQIGTCDSTGASSGHHLHWSMKIVANNSMTLDADNGYYGAVDFSGWFSNAFVNDGGDAEVKRLQLTVIKLATQVISLLEKIIEKKKSQ